VEHDILVSITEASGLTAQGWEWHN